MTPTNEQFLTALAGAMPVDERLILCDFFGDPNKVDLRAWKPRAWRPGKDTMTEDGSNNYVTISSFRIAPDRTWRRRGELWAAGRALMIDDIGTKLPSTVIDPLPPTAMVETSPGNFQAWYFLRPTVDDRWAFDAMIRAFIAQKLLGNDPGMSGITRVGRLPVGRNGKSSLGRDGWATQCVVWEPDRRATFDEIVSAFGLELKGRRKLNLPRLLPDDLGVRAELFLGNVRWLDSHGMMKRLEPDMSGWMEMHCPWRDNHTNRADTGAAIRQPDEENGYNGAFRCHHGHCAKKGWRDLVDWIDEHAVQSMTEVNARSIKGGNYDDGE